MSPSSNHFPSKKKPWVATGVTVSSAMPLPLFERANTLRRAWRPNDYRTSWGSAIHSNVKSFPALMSFPSLGFQSVVDFHLVSCNQPIGFVRHANHGHQLLELIVGHTFVYRRCSRSEERR